MVNYVLSFCKITGASRIFSRNFYLPLLKPLTPKEALRTYRITGKWLLGAKIQHYIPVLLNHKKKRSKRLKNFGKKSHDEMDDYTYMMPVFDAENEGHKLLQSLLETNDTKGVFVYTVHDKKYNIVLQAALENAILKGDIIDVLVSQRNDKIIVKLKSMKKIPMEIQYFEGDGPMYCGEGATAPEDEKFHHHGQYTMSLARMFEEREMIEEKWEEELRKIMRRKRKRAKETREWRELMKQGLKNLDWKRFEEDAKKVIDEIEEPAGEKDIDMEIDDLEKTKNVNETLIKQEMLNQLPTMKEIPDIIKNMSNAELTEVEDEVIDEVTRQKRRVSGVKVTLPSGKECFVSGQMVHTEEGDVFVPGQTVVNEFGMEYAPGITINVDNKPTLINGLIMGEEERDPMFLPTESTITADGQLTFATSQEERPQVEPEKREMKKKKKWERLRQAQAIAEEDSQENVEEKQEENGEENDKPQEIILVFDEGSESESCLSDSCITESSEPKSLNDVSSIELNNSDLEELDMEAMRLKHEQQRIELEKLKAILMDDGMDDLIASIEDKRAQLQKKLEELRQLSISMESTLVSYITDNETSEIAGKLTNDPDTINRLSEILMTMTQRAATFRDKNSLNADNINLPTIPVSNLTEADVKFNASSNKVKMLLKTITVAANDVFKTRPKDQIMALNAIGDILVDLLKTDHQTLNDLVKLMNTRQDRNDICNAIFKQLCQNIAETKVTALNNMVEKNSSSHDVLEGVEKMLKKHAEIKSDAFAKVAKVDGKLVGLLVGQITKRIDRVKNEDEAVEVLQECMQEATKQLIKDNLRNLLVSKSDLNVLKEDSLAFAKALGLIKVEEKLSECSKLSNLIDKPTLDFLERVTLIRQLAEKDYSLKTAIERVKKNPERARSDPRIRQLIRESASLLGKGAPIRTSRDIPLHLMKTQNLLAIEDFLLHRSSVDYPVLISRNDLQAVIPKEASRGVLAGRVSYALIDESGVTNFKPIHMFAAVNVNKNRENRIDNYLNGSVSTTSKNDDDRKKYLQAKSNGSDASWASPSSHRTMSSSSLYRGYAGPRA